MYLRVRFLSLCVRIVVEDTFVHPHRKDKKIYEEMTTLWCVTALSHRHHRHVYG